MQRFEGILDEISRTHGLSSAQKAALPRRSEVVETLGIFCYDVKGPDYGRVEEFPSDLGSLSDKFTSVSRDFLGDTLALHTSLTWNAVAAHIDAGSEQGVAYYRDFLNRYADALKEPKRRIAPFRYLPKASAPP